jgi:uncharacterized protein YdeI (YjbR/CyaY-like superfamily)
VTDIPVELREALDANPGARRRFEGLSPSHRRQHIDYVAGAKQPETRARRAQRTVIMLDASSRTEPRSED